MWHKLAKFHWQAVFTSQVIHWNIFLVLCLGIWWCHEIWKCRILNFDFLKNKKKFWRKIKTFFLMWKVLSFRPKNKLTKMSRTQLLKVNESEWLKKLVNVQQHLLRFYFNLFWFVSHTKTKAKLKPKNKINIVLWETFHSNFRTIHLLRVSVRRVEILVFCKILRTY